jgi:SET domain-containing protein
VCGGECLDLDHFPKTEVRISKLPSAGLGLFAAEDIKKGTVIGVFEGEVEPNVDESSHDCFEIAEGISLRCNKMGVYYANEQRDRKANARFRYLEGKRRREMIIIAKTDIKKGGEITTQYSNPNTYGYLAVSYQTAG